MDGAQEVARVHQYLRLDGRLGASGLPDPKRILENGVLYRLRKSPTGRVEAFLFSISDLRDRVYWMFGREIGTTN